MLGREPFLLMQAMPAFTAAISEYDPLVHELCLLLLYRKSTRSLSRKRLTTKSWRCPLSTKVRLPVLSVGARTLSPALG